MLSPQKILKSEQKIITNMASWMWKHKAIAIVILLSVICYFQFVNIDKLKEERNDLKIQLVSLPKPEDYTEIKNKTSRLEKDNKDLQEAIDYLKSKGETVRVVTKTKTILMGNTEVVNQLPNSYVFKLYNGMPVAAIQIEGEDEWDLITYDLTFKSAIIVTDNNTLVKLTANSTGSKETFELPVEITTHIEKSDGSKEEKERILDPRIALGVGVSLPYTNPEVTISVPVLEGPMDRLSWIAPSISISDTIKVGVIPVMFNVAKPLPLVDNIWLGVGYETDLINHYGAITLSAKL